ncbi:MAG: hypothetical protein IT555_09725 [Acetobacteraceae bacterium]|nr:hypothetical protein [Acetobacteraceae bacterium]
MTPDAFEASLSADAPPDGLAPAVQGLWWDGKGDWGRAHQCAQDQDDRTGAAVHAYLHRKEGDLANAGYWYARAGRSMPAGTLAAEWRGLVDELLAQG